MAELTGRELGLPEERINRLRLAMLVCDAGQPQIPAASLDPRAPDGPWRKIEAQPELDRALTRPQELDEVRAWIRARRERPDGRGQPRGLTREQIPVEARILSVVDAYVAITTDRPQSPAKHQAFALRELLDRAGSQFDARVVAAFVRARPR